MCGIFGIAAHDTQIPDGLLERGTQSLAHRGPDDSGTVVVRYPAGEIGLGNRRLAILDLSSLGHQPTQDPDTGNWVVYNGEIYNFREVRRELEQGGAAFVSHSDTEVLLKAYARWGDGCLSRFRGMFAFALWDARQHILFIARDPMGIKPLYYAQTGKFFLFASEVRTLIETGLIRPRIDPAGLLNFLTFGSAYDPLTLIKGVSTLPAGSMLVWQKGKIRESQYWDLLDLPSENTEPSPSRRNDDGPATEIQKLLEESVRMQLVSDVPVGIFLSGGIDSSALVSIVSRGGLRPSTFSIVFREADYSEAEYSRAVAQKFRTDHHEITVSQTDLLKAIPDALGAMDLPTMDGINTYFVSRETRNAGVKVALSGLGGDEVFAGYSSFRTIPRWERVVRMWGHIPGFIRRGTASSFGAMAPTSDQNRKLSLLMRNGERVLHPYFVSRMLFTPKQRGNLMQGVNSDVDERASAEQRQRLNLAARLDPINRVSYLESRCYMLNTLLRDADVMSMSQGLEVRVPLIDHELAKNVMKVPGVAKIGTIPKKLLVEALGGSLPEGIVQRRKRGFTLPFEHWMRQELRSEIEPKLSAEKVSRGPLGPVLNGKEVERIWNSFLAGTVSWTRPWSLYVLQHWSELQNVSA
jgi:asparagine synthase (glutamine-hydrolysing)